MKKLSLALVAMLSTVSMSSVLAVEDMKMPERQTIFKIGSFDKAKRGKKSAKEFAVPVGVATADEVVIVKVPFGAKVRRPGKFGIPGYMNSPEGGTFVQVCAENGYSCSTSGKDFYTAQTLVFKVDLARSGVYGCRDIKLKYSRHGSEANYVSLYAKHNGGKTYQALTSNGKERKAKVHKKYLGDVFPDRRGRLGHMKLIIDYLGTGKDNGNFIDALELSGYCKLRNGPMPNDPRDEQQTQ